MPNFAVVITGVYTLLAAALLARAVQALGKAVQIAADGSPRVTASIGVAEARLPQESAEQGSRRADAALYGAKAGGRNRVVAAAGLAFE